jgi:hypothetical protein
LPPVQGGAHTFLMNGRCLKIAATSAATRMWISASGYCRWMARRAGVMKTASPKYLNWMIRIFWVFCFW